MTEKYVVVSPFTARTAKGDVPLQVGSTIQLPEKSASQLVEMGKIKPVTQPISQETLNAIFTEVSEKLSVIYKGGEYEYARVHHPELYQAERDALNYVDSIWFDALAGKTSLDVFRQVVDGWYKSVRTLIEKVNTDKKK